MTAALLREWTVQKSLIVDQTNLVLVCGKLVLQKKTEGGEDADVRDDNLRQPFLNVSHGAISVESSHASH